MSWTVKANGIKTPAGMYKPDTTDLKDAIYQAARFAGLNEFDVIVDGNHIDTEEDLLATDMTRVAVVEIKAYDTAA